ncbi:nicolin-1-like [Liolophura sinensis]|uniref:nicolin-1-like n=1 Tax=Liolophura sinensis TaxID=3198878 RepID=UPI00315809B3
MAARPLNCNIRNPVSLRVGEHKADFHSGCKIIDCSFPNILHPEVGEIHFKNFYTALLTVRVKFRSKEHGSEVGDMKWQKCIDRMKLMPDPHCETGSQDYFVISRKQFPFDLVNVAAIRLILQQPSPVWKDFRIEELKIYKTSKDDSKSAPLPAWLTDNELNKKEKAVERVPNISELSSCLQELWSLSEQAASQQTTAALGRYDVDGCYEINLLSYT